jgi:hypothetical protein
MKLPQTGGCQCGKIRYEISEAPQLVLYLPLPGLPAPDQQRVLARDRRIRGRISHQRRRAAAIAAPGR